MRRSIQRCAALLRPHGWLCALAAGSAVCSVAVSVLLREYLGGVLDGILQSAVDWPRAAAVLGLGFVLSTALTYGKSWSVTRLLHGLRARLYRNAYAFLLYDEAGDFSLGELSSLLSNDVMAVINAVNRIFSNILSNLFFFLFSLAVIWGISPVIAAVTVLAAAVPSAAVTALSKRQKEQQQQYMAELAKVNNTAADGLFSLESVKANALEEQYSRQYSSALDGLLGRKRRLAKTQALLTAPSVFCAFAIQLVIIVVSGWFTAVGAIPVASFFVVITLMEYIVNPVMSLENSLMAVRSLNVSLKRLEKLLEDRKDAAPEVPAASAAPSVSLRDVSFAYTPGHPVLERFSLQMEPGKCHYIVGANGAGKSTLIKLAGGLLRPSAGSVLLCGREAADIPKGGLSSYISVMPQEPVLFSDTVLENIRLRQPELSREVVIEACRRAGVHEDIMALPEQYDTLLSENGGTLSGGQKQRLSLARTILRDSPVMLFDEPTAALDDGHARQAAELIQSLAGEKVVAVITHDTRLRTEEGHVIRLEGGR